VGNFLTTQQKQSFIQIIIEVGAGQVALCFSPLLFQFERQTGLLEDENNVLEIQQISSLRLLMKIKIMIMIFLTTMSTISDIRMACPMQTLTSWKVPYLMLFAGSNFDEFSYFFYDLNVSRHSASSWDPCQQSKH
jgi:hypothetical protein